MKMSKNIEYNEDWQQTKNIRIIEMKMILNISWSEVARMIFVLVGIVIVAYVAIGSYVLKNTTKSI